MKTAGAPGAVATVDGARGIDDAAAVPPRRVSVLKTMLLDEACVVILLSNLMRTKSSFVERS